MGAAAETRKGADQRNRLLNQTSPGSSSTGAIWKPMSFSTWMAAWLARSSKDSITA